MQDLWDELYGSRGRYSGDRWNEPEVWEREGEKGPDKHGYRYFLFYGCRCEVCVRGCEARQQWVRPSDASAA